jgi:inosine/xanthosine triphosphatase
MKIVVTSKNPVKINAAERGVKMMFPEAQLEMIGSSASSGVADQPMSDEETRRGALNRINHILTSMPDADLYVSMEGGIEDKPDVHGVMQMVCFAWVVVRDKNGKWGESRSADLTLPFAVADLVRQGFELGEADDRVFGRNNSKQQNGAVGLLTKDAITRAAYYEMPVALALLPIVNSDLY